MPKPKMIEPEIRQKTIDEIVELLLKHAEESRNQRRNRPHERNVFLPIYIEEVAVKVAKIGASKKFIDSVVRKCLEGEWFWGLDGTQYLGLNLIKEVGCSRNLMEKFAEKLAANFSLNDFEALLKILGREPSQEEILALVKKYTTRASESDNTEMKLLCLAENAHFSKEDLRKIRKAFYDNHQKWIGVP